MNVSIFLSKHNQSAWIYKNIDSLFPGTVEAHYWQRGMCWESKEKRQVLKFVWFLSFGACGKLGLGTIVYLEEAFLRRVWENVFFLIKTLLIFQEREV